MNKIDFNDMFYVCMMIEYVARKTCNKRGVIIDKLGEDGIRKQIKDASVNHCLSVEQIADEWVKNYKIENDDFDTVSSCRYTVPESTDIGKLYAYLIEDLTQDTDDEVLILMDLFKSYLSDEISNFNTDLYYQNTSYLCACYKEGKVLE